MCIELQTPTQLSAGGRSQLPRINGIISPMMKCVVCGGTKFQILFPHKNGHVGKCESCELAQVVPMPTKADIAKLYHEDFDHFTPYLEQIEVHRAYFRRVLRDVIPADDNRRLRLLDIGCALGVLLEEAKKVGFMVQGIDISKDAVKYCKKKGLEVSQKWPKKQFDIVTAFQIIEHERDPLVFMKRVHTLLNKGGLVVLATPDSGGMWRKIMGKRWVGFTHPEHVVLLNFNSMRVLLEKAGFKHIEIRRDSPRPFPLSFAFKRAGDYFPSLKFLLLPLGKLFDHFQIKNLINPWDDMIVYAKK